MSDYSSYAKRDAYNEAIFNKINEYLEEKDIYSANAVLAINKKSKEIEYGEPAEFDIKWDVYTLGSIIRSGENGELEPNVDETFELASKYYFVK
jgi:hypothetical protein